MNRCRTCKWWVQDATYDSLIPSLEEKQLIPPYCGHTKCDNYETADDNNAFYYSYNEGGVIHTGPDFGCVHWEAGE